MAVASIATWVEGMALAGHPAVCFSVCLAVVCLPPISCGLSPTYFQLLSPRVSKLLWGGIGSFQAFRTFAGL